MYIMYKISLAKVAMRLYNKNSYPKKGRILRQIYRLIEGAVA